MIALCFIVEFLHENSYVGLIILQVQNPLFLLRKVDKSNHLEDLQIGFLVGFHFLHHLLLGHKHNHIQRIRNSYFF